MFINILCDCGKFLREPYLLEAENAGQKDVFVRGKGSVSITDLLNGVEEAAMREKIAQIPVSVFISYCHQDDSYRQELRVALSPLERLKKLKIWDDHDINAGEEWEKEVFRELNTSDIVLCLVSADYINSDFCYSEELNKALESGKIVVPVKIRKCAWESLPIAKLRGTPSAGWIASSENRDEAWTEVAHHLEPLVMRVKEKKLKERRWG